MRFVPFFTLAVSVLALVSALSACDQLNKPMPVVTGGTSASSGAVPSPADAGNDGDLPALPPPGDPPRIAPHPDDTQL